MLSVPILPGINQQAGGYSRGAANGSSLWVSTDNIAGCRPQRTQSQRAHWLGFSRGRNENCCNHQQNNH